MRVSKQNLISGFTGAVMAASTAFSPTAISAQEISSTETNVQTVALEHPIITLHIGDEVNERRVASILRGLSRDNIPVEIADGFERTECIGLSADGVLLSVFDERSANLKLPLMAREVYNGHSIGFRLEDGPCAYQA